MLLSEALLGWLRQPFLNTVITGPRPMGPGHDAGSILSQLKRWPSAWRPLLRADPAFNTPNTEVRCARSCCVFDRSSEGAHIIAA